MASLLASFFILNFLSLSCFSSFSSRHLVCVLKKKHQQQFGTKSLPSSSNFHALIRGRKKAQVPRRRGVLDRAAPEPRPRRPQVGEGGGENTSGPRRTSIWQSFGRPALGCIEADSCNCGDILQHLSRSTRSTRFCSF